MQPNNDKPSPFASVIGLGPLKAEFRPGGKVRWFTLGFGILCLAAAPCLGLTAVAVGYTTYQQRGLVKVDDVVIPILIGAGLALLIGGLIVFNEWRNWHVAAALYENGVAYTTRSGVRQVQWNEIDSVWQAVTRHYHNGVYTGTTHTYTLKTKNGERIVFDDRLGKNVENLGNEVQRCVSVAVFPRYWQALQSGQRVDFGPLALDREKLYAGKKELRWDEIKAIKVERGMISVKRDKGWFNWASASVPQIPNFFVFYELVGRFANVE